MLDHSFARFAEFLSGIETDGVPLEERVDQFIDRAWQHFGGDHYRSTFEILLNDVPDDEAGADDEPIWQTEMFASWNRVWNEIFSDVSLPRRKVVALQTFAISMFSGMASLAMLDRAIEPVRSAELRILKDTLLREMSG